MNDQVSVVLENVLTNSQRLGFRTAASVLAERALQDKDPGAYIYRVACGSEHAAHWSYIAQQLREQWI